MTKTKILFITHEMSPFLELSEIAKITRQLPQAMQEKGYEIRILMPRFGNINERRNRLHEVIRLSGLNIVINENDNPLIIKVASIPTARMQVYFLDNEEYFHRKHVFSDGHNKFFEDNDERAIFFCKGALETVKKLGWSPDIVHCHGWMSSLVPLFMKTVYKDDPTFKHSRVVYSAYEKSFDAHFHTDFSRKVVMQGIPAADVESYMRATTPGGTKQGSPSELRSDSCSVQLGAIGFSDAIVVGDDNLSPAVSARIKSSVKPVLHFHDTGDYEKFFQFYEELLASNSSDHSQRSSGGEAGFNSHEELTDIASLAS